MLNKYPPEPTASEHLKTLMERQQTLPGSWPSGRIEMVGSPLGSVAVGIFPNGTLETVRIVVVDEHKGELTTQMTFVHTKGEPLVSREPSFYSAIAFIDTRITTDGGLEEPWPHTEARRLERVNLVSILSSVASAGSAYDPFQIEALQPHLIAAVDSQALIHPAVMRAVQAIRS